MKLECIITLANKQVELRFLALVRSLRAVGSHLPVIAIPYDDNTFTLPENCSYWQNAALFNWLSKYPMGGVKRKYAALTLENYHFVDSDVVFLQNPETALTPYTGFVSCCGHWRSTDHIATPKLKEFLRSKSSLWQRLIFNSGQFACDQALYREQELMQLCETSAFCYNTLEFPHHEQPGLNQLVHASNISYSNLTLPPTNLESSWAGDYQDGALIRETPHSPYLMHWAGMLRGRYSNFDELFLQYLTHAERQRLKEEERMQTAKRKSFVDKIKSKCLKFLKSSYHHLK